MWKFGKVKKKYNFGSRKYHRWWSKAQDKISLFSVVVYVLEKTTLWKVMRCWGRKVLNLKDSRFGVEEYNDTFVQER
jgi:hypothetical protein